VLLLQRGGTAFSVKMTQCFDHSLKLESTQTTRQEREGETLIDTSS